MCALLGQDVTKRGQYRGHGRPNGPPPRARLICIVFLMMYAAPQSASTRPELPRGRSAAAPGTLQGGQNEAKIGQMRGHGRPHGPNTTELSFDSGVHFRLRSLSPRSSSAHQAYLLWFRVLSMNLSRHRPPRRRHHRHQHGQYHHRLRHRHAA